jgi:DNA mismatch endonuclease (patch repair protein)
MRRAAGDVFSKEKRSDVMRAVRGANTRPEIALRKALFAQGLRYRLHESRLPGRPDIVLPRHRSAIFVNGCFWHGHDCPRGRRRPKANARYWREKIARNRARDVKSAAALRRLGWRVFLVWECGLKDPGRAAQSLARRIRGGRRAT